MIGGSGERKTLRMVAQYADLGNLTCEPAEVPRKVEALAGHCERLGRDRGHCGRCGAIDQREIRDRVITEQVE